MIKFGSVDSGNLNGTKSYSVHTSAATPTSSTMARL